MLNGFDEKRLSKEHGNINVFHFSGARIEDINQYIIPSIKKQLYYLILHVGTNDTTSKKIFIIYLFILSSKLTNLQYKK